MFGDAYATKMTIPHGLKLDHQSNQLSAICVELRVILHLFSAVMHISLGVFMVHIHITLDLCLKIFYFLILHGVFLGCRF